MNNIFRQPGETGIGNLEAEKSAGFATRKNYTISLDIKGKICNYNNVFFILGS